MKMLRRFVINSVAATQERSDGMDDHAKAVAARWGKKRAAALADGMKPEAFDKHMLAFMRWGGWSESNAQAICKRAQELSEKGVNECEQS